MVFALSDGNVTAGGGSTAGDSTAGDGMAGGGAFARSDLSANRSDGGSGRGRRLLGKRRGRTRRQPLAVVPWDEPLAWDVSLGRCVSARSGRVVAWANGKPLEAESRRKDERMCCTFNTLVTSWWNEMLHPKRWRPLPRPHEQQKLEAYLTSKR